jgi:phage shock protein A
MGMWQRLKRVGRSFVGFFISSMEDPELILEQNIRDLNDQVPKMNESIAMVRANVTLLEKEQTKYRSEIAEITSKVKAAIQAGRDDIAASYAIQLQQLKGHLHQNEGQLEAARAAYEKSLNVKKAFMREKERKTRDAMQAIRDNKRAQWQSKVADALESFEVVGLDATHDEMIRKIEEKTAINEARMEMALDSIDHQGLQIEEDAEKIRANELVQQFKLQMGMEQGAALGEGAAATSIGEESGKTIGKKVGVE